MASVQRQEREKLMIRPLGPFTVRPRQVAAPPRRSPSAGCLEGRAACVTPVRPSVRGSAQKLAGDLRVLGKPSN